ETGIARTLSFAALHALVSRLARALAATGVGPGDRVAGYLPNLPESIAAMLATASLGAIWSSCSPDFGVQGVLDRFGQIAPKVLFATDRNFYNGRMVDCTARVAEVAARLPALERVVVIPYDADDMHPNGSGAGPLLADFIAAF